MEGRGFKSCPLLLLPPCPIAGVDDATIGGVAGLQLISRSLGITVVGVGVSDVGAFLVLKSLSTSLDDLTSFLLMSEVDVLIIFSTSNPSEREKKKYVVSGTFKCHNFTRYAKNI